MEDNLIRFWSTPVDFSDNAARGMGLVYYDGTPETKHEFRPGQFEALAPGAEIIKHRDDVLCCFNHDMGQVLGRESNDTLKLFQDGRGVHYKVELNPKDPQHQSVAAKLDRGDAKGSSAILRPMKSVWKDGVLLFTKILLQEIGPVTSPAMTATINYSETINELSAAHYETQKRLSELK